MSAKGQPKETLPSEADPNITDAELEVALYSGTRTSCVALCNVETISDENARVAHIGNCGRCQKECHK